MFQLITDDHYDELFDLSCSSQKAIKIISPFITEDVTDVLLNSFNEQKNIEFSIITRFHRKDFATMASDIDALVALVKHGVKLYAVQNLHTKLYLFDERSAVLGSANFTVGGLFNNIELSIKTEEASLVKSLNDYYLSLFEKAKEYPITLEQLLSEKAYINKNPIKISNPQEQFYYGARLFKWKFLNEELKEIDTSDENFPIINDLKKLPEKEMAYVLSTLPPKLRDVVRLRFNIGLNNNKIYTFKEIGELLGLEAKNNRSHPRQALASALCKLHNPIRYRRIKGVPLG